MPERTKFFRTIFENYFKLHEDDTSPKHYKILNKNIIAIMLMITVVPHTIMICIDYYQLREKHKGNVENAMHILADKTKYSVEMYLEKKLSIIRLITNEYTIEELENKTKLNRILWVLKKEFKSFIDLAVINPAGKMVNYAGPQPMPEIEYSTNNDYQQAQIKDGHISNIISGYGNQPQIVIMVSKPEEAGAWTLRASMDIKKMSSFLDQAKIGAASDVFLVNSEGLLQSNSKYNGSYFETCRLNIPSTCKETSITKVKGPNNKDLLLAYSGFNNFDYRVVITQPVDIAFKQWNTLKTEIIIVYIISIFIIAVIVFKISGILIHRIITADEKRERAFRDLQHNHKLSSIGRLAAGIAHEINNPLAIINEKAGLMKDLVEYSDDFSHKEKFNKLTASIANSVDRCRTITHRLLGFARRIDVLVEPVNINDVVKDVLGFLENEALYRKIDIRLELLDNLTRISSDRGQLQQVFLNILTNSFAAVEDGGFISVTTKPYEKGGVQILFEDNGCGMSEEVMKQIFEPFFSTKKGYGTGLGLSITFGIVKKLGGDLHVKSIEGKGTIFNILLPSTPENPLEV